MSACSESQSTIFPLPSSPHWEPTTTTLAMSCPSAVWPEMIATQQWITQAPALPELSEAIAAGKAAHRGQARPSGSRHKSAAPLPGLVGRQRLTNQLTKRRSRGDIGAIIHNAHS